MRCGEGLWTLSAFEPGERAEVDTPGLRLTAKPVAWRITALTLLTRGRCGAHPANNRGSQTTGASASRNATTTLPPLVIDINGTTLPVQPNNPVEIEVGAERVRIVLRIAP